MPNEVETQEPSITTPVVVTQPTGGTDWQAEATRLASELALSQRQYNGLQGTLKTVQTDRDKYKAEVENVAQRGEADKLELTGKFDTLNSQFGNTAQERDLLKTQLTQINSEHETLKLITAEFPDLAPLVASGKIRTAGLEGEALTAFLTGWREDLKTLGVTARANHVAGTTPPAPNPNQVALTLEEAGRKKNEALRKQGAFSAEYQQYSRMEEELIRQMPIVGPVIHEL